MHTPAEMLAATSEEGTGVFQAKKKSFAEAKDYIWQGRRDSNSRHPVLETGALPTELRP